MSSTARVEHRYTAKTHITIKTFFFFAHFEKPKQNILHNQSRLLTSFDLYSSSLVSLLSLSLFHGLSLFFISIHTGWSINNTPIRNLNISTNSRSKGLKFLAVIETHLKFFLYETDRPITSPI